VKKKKKIRDCIRRWKYSRTGKSFCFLFNISYGIKGGPWLRYDAARGIYYTDIPEYDTRIYLARQHQARRGSMHVSVMARLQELAKAYSLDMVEVADSDVIVDVGANIGEIGMYYEIMRGGVNYFALEPMAKEALCCQLNNPGKTVLRQALWKENSQVRFYQSVVHNDDSSIFEPPHYECAVNIPAITLEKFATDHGIGKIKILKVETEGAEPEVLMGAEKILHRIEYIAADLGPERGLEQKTTLPMVLDFLYPRGFKVVSGYAADRRNFLFRNMNYGGGSKSIV